MKVEGIIYKANLITGSHLVYKKDTDSFSKDLSFCLLEICKELNIEIPLWLDKNTSEFSKFHQTIFFAEQFESKQNFDRFQLKLLKE